MLRLRPSEITLTPADVEETRRRMSRKLQAGQSALMPSITSYPHRGPKLRRGPVRSRDDAVHLGKIPVLTPHQVIHASAASEAEPGQAHQSASIEEASDSDDKGDELQPSGLQTEQTSPSPTRPLQLPFRPAPSLDVAQGRLVARGNADVETSPSPPKRSPEVSRFGRTRTNTSEDHSEGGFPTRLHHSIDGSAADIHSPSAMSRARAIRQQLGLASPAQGQAQAGYFVSPDCYTFRESYHMPHTEPRQRSGRFAPRNRTLSSTSDPSHSMPGLNSSRTRPTPSGDVFWTSQPAAPLVDGEHVATGVIEQPDPPDGGERPRHSLEERIRTLHTRLQSTQGRMRNFFERREAHEQHGSEEVTEVHPTRSDRLSEGSSNSSLPYSYYELPASRHSSMDHSPNMEQPSPAQYDGAGASRPVSRGAYFSIRPSQVHARDPTTGRPSLARVSSFSSPNLTAPGAQHLSPRPASPYSRVDAGQGPSRVSQALLTPDDLLGADRDAAVAAERDMPSPLDLVAQRAYIQLTQAPPVMPAVRQASTVPAGTVTAGPRVTASFQYQVDDFDAEPRRRGAPGPGGMRQESGNAAHFRMLQLGRQAAEMRASEPLHHRHERSSTQNSEPPAYARIPRTARSGQRSSENVPVGAMPVYGPRPNSRTQRVSIGNTVRPRTSQGVAMRGGGGEVPHPQRLFYPNVRHQPSMRHLGRGSSGGDRFLSSSPNPLSPPHAHPQNLNQNYRQRTQRPAQNSSPSRVRRTMTSTSSTYSSDDGLHGPRQPTLRHPPGSLGVPQFPHQRQLRASALPVLPIVHRPADTTLTVPYSLTSRRPPIPARIASRRIPVQQRNQENSGDAEAELMREEMAAASMRYADDGVGLDVLDETPPRVGRFERRILEN